MVRQHLHRLTFSLLVAAAFCGSCWQAAHLVSRTEAPPANTSTPSTTTPSTSTTSTSSASSNCGKWQTAAGSAAPPSSNHHGFEEPWKTLKLPRGADSSEPHQEATRSRLAQEAEEEKNKSKDHRKILLGGPRIHQSPLWTAASSNSTTKTAKPPLNGAALDVLPAPLACSPGILREVRETQEEQKPIGSQQKNRKKEEHREKAHLSTDEITGTSSSSDRTTSEEPKNSGQTASRMLPQHLMTAGAEEEESFAETR